MGQIVSGAAKPKRCNVQSLSQLGTPAAGEYILVSSDNSMNAAGQGNFDCYIEGNGTTAATSLLLKRIDDVFLANFTELNSETPDLALSDENSFLLVEFRDGEIKTKKFDSSKVNTTRDEEFIDCGIVDENGNAVVVFENGNIRTKNFNSANVDIDTALYPLSYSGEKISVGRTNKMAVELLFSTTHSVTRSIQGAACYGGYLFVAQDYMYSIAVYDIESKQLVNDISLTSSSTYHCNNISFGRWKYNTTDFSPCLYVSMENANEHKCIVFQVTYSNGVFALTQVQTITYPAPATYNTYYPNAFIDAQNGEMFVMGYSTYSYQQSDSTKINILQYELPLPTNGDVTLSAPTTTASIPSEYAAQGGFIEEGKLYQVFGIPSGTAENTFLKVRSIGGSWPLLTSISLRSIGITIEPEAVCLNNDYLLIVCVDGKVYKLTFKK